MPRKNPLLAGLLSFTFSLALSAQTPDTASIQGQVTDQTHRVLFGIQVTATNTRTGLERRTETDASGTFSLASFKAM